jgi:hypothetical protein
MHTPGPWTCDKYDTKHGFPARQLVFGGGSLLAEVCGNGKGSSGDNANLITTAPELLAALKRAVPWLGRLIADGGHLNSVAPNDAIGALAQAEAAIAKADSK